MTKARESAVDSLSETDANEVILDNLKRQKNVVKMQLTKLYARLTNDSNV